MKVESERLLAQQRKKSVDDLNRAGVSVTVDDIYQLERYLSMNRAGVSVTVFEKDLDRWDVVSGDDGKKHLIHYDLRGLQIAEFARKLRESEPSQDIIVD